VLSLASTLRTRWRKGKKTQTKKTAGN